MTPLELRYRRLLAWYPPEHRAAHEEEMVGVLMASADPEQARPGVRDSVDLASGAVRIQVRRAFGAGSGKAWRDSLAVTGTVGLLVTLLYFASRAVMSIPLGAFSQVIPVVIGIGVGVAIVLDRRWVAAVLAWTLVVLHGHWLISAASLETWSSVGFWSASWISLLLLTVAVALTMAPSPRRGPVLLRTRRLIPWLLLTLVAIAGSSVLANGAAVVVVATAAAGMAFSSTVGRRVVVLLTLPFLAYLCSTAMNLFASTGWLAATLLVALPSMILVGFTIRTVPKRARAVGPPNAGLAEE